MDRLLAMKVFLRVSDEGGFAAAARAMDLSPAAVTRLVADLERHLGVRLLNRNTRRVALTQAGAAYLERVRPLLRDLDEAEALASAHTRELSGELRIAASPALATHVLAPLLAGFRQQHPRVSVELEATAGHQTHLEGFDLTLFGAEPGFDADVIARPIMETDEVLVASPGYLARRGTPRHPDELPAHEFLATRRPGQRSSALRLWPPGQPEAAVATEVSPALTSHHLDTVLRAALADAGITAVPLDLVAPYLSTGQLVRVLSPWVAGRLTLYVAMPSRRFLPERTRRFLDYLVDETRRQTALALAACEACRPEGTRDATPSPEDPAAEAPAVRFIHPDEALAARHGPRPWVLVDVRGPAPASPSAPDTALPGALRATPGRVADAVRHLPADTPLLTLCACPGDAGAASAARELVQAGHRTVRVLRGGVDAWRAAQEAVRPRAVATA